MTSPTREFRRRANLRVAARLAPALVVAVLLWADHVVPAAGVFALVFISIAYVTLAPATRLLGPVTVKLPEETGVLITIDDGPCPETTPALLDVLDRYQAKALFFVIGDRVAQWPELARLIVSRGHAIGNHTQRHRAHWFWAFGAAQTWREIAECQGTLDSVLGQRPVWFRAPVGHYNLFTHPALAALGMHLMSWSARGYDGIDKDVPRMLRRLRRGIKPGAIILLHDATPAAVAVLEGVLETLRERGLVTVPPHVAPRSGGY